LDSSRWWLGHKQVNNLTQNTINLDNSEKCFSKQEQVRKFV
jgi:hypothetical protein